MTAPPTTAARKYQLTTTKTKYQPIHISSTNSSYVTNVINKTLTKKKTTLYETATLYGASTKKVVELFPEHVSHPAFGLQLC